MTRPTSLKISAEHAASSRTQPGRPDAQRSHADLLRLGREIGALLSELATILANQTHEQLDAPHAQHIIQGSPWLDFEAARRYLRFSRDKLYKLTAAGAIPYRKKEGGQGLMFHRDELDHWMEDAYPRVDRLG